MMKKKDRETFLNEHAMNSTKHETFLASRRRVKSSKEDSIPVILLVQFSKQKGKW